MICYDQHNLGNNASAECVAREIQTQEIRYAEKVTGALDETSECHILSGAMSYGNLCIMPAVREFLRDTLKARNDINKERRKAREERGLLKPKK